ncbi:MAG: DNA internalization-related competence protein ComEC/Rec2 [Abditibacteriaceae bacterium]
MTFTFTRWEKSLALRPLLWISPAVIGGCAAGAAWAQMLQFGFHGNATRDLSILWLPFVALTLLGLLCWRCYHQKYFWYARIVAAVAIGCGFCGYCARRVLPPNNDLSQLVRYSEIQSDTQLSALKKTPVVLQGYVAATPRIGDFNQEFPLKSTSAQSDEKVLLLHGNVWISAPLNWKVQVGDLIQIQAGLRDLPRVGSASEPEPDWRYILHDCWSMVRLGNHDSWRILPAARPWQYRIDYHLGYARRWLLHLYEQRFIHSGVSYPRVTAQLMVAMVFGDGALGTPLPPLVRNNFRAAGLTHLLVASGTQVSLMVLMISGVFKLFGLRRFPWLLFLLLLILLAIYALLVGGAASIWRAFIAGICVTVALLLGRPIDILSLWCFAAVALLAIDPLQIFDLSFQLTFGATWGLIVIAPAIFKLIHDRYKSTFTRGIITVGVYTIAAQLAVLPMLVYHFGKFSLAGLGTNFVGIPIAGMLVGTGIIGVAVPWLAWPNALMTQIVLKMTALAGSLDWVQQRGITFSLPGIVAFYLTLMMLPSWEEVKLIGHDEWHTWLSRQGQRWHGINWLHVGVWSLALIAVFWAGSLALHRNAGLNVALLDVGQGDSIFIQTPSGRSILIDGGTINENEHGKVGDSVIVPYLQAHGVKRLDAILLTHSDSDHCNALDEVMNEVPVGLFLDESGTREPSGKIVDPSLDKTDYWILRKEAAAHRVPRKLAQAGQILQLGDGVQLQILEPMRPILDSSNNHSMVAKLIYGKTSVLLTGDMEAEEEDQLVHRGVNLQCTILKVGHHGSATSSTATFLQAVHPAAAIISCGRYNPFGHPATSTLERLKKLNIPWFRTDLQGTIEIQSDGEKCWIKTFR